MDLNPTRTFENNFRFKYIYHWVAGSVPPPYHDEYDVTISDQGGVLEYWSDYRRSGSESKKYFFKLDQTKVAGLRDSIKSVGYRLWMRKDPPGMGGELEWLEGEDGARIPPDLIEADKLMAVEIYQLIKSIVPQGIWKEIQKVKDPPSK